METVTDKTNISCKLGILSRPDGSAILSEGLLIVNFMEIRIGEKKSYFR